MLIWLLAAGAAIVLAVIQYRGERRAWQTRAFALLRGVAVLLAVALALDAPRGLVSTPRPVVALDASASWLRGRADSAWGAAVARARAAARGDTVWLVGDSLRPLRDARSATDVATKVEPAVDRAVGAGRPLTLISDGELDDPRVLDRVLAGSRLDIVPPASTPDAAVLALELPRSIVGGDTAEVLVRVAAGAAGAPAGSATLTIDKAASVRLPIDALAPGAERDVRVRVRVPVEGGEHRVVRVALSVPGDAVARNDTLGAALDVSESPHGVFVSTAPDEDARFALDVLRGTLAIAVRAYYRVAPGVWRQEPGFTPVPEADVRRALAAAPFAIIHGDTALFGPPRTLTTGALALLVPATTEADEWYAVAAPASPLAPALAGLPWDSLPPVAIASPATGEWTALTARRPRTLRDERSLITGSEHPRRVVIVGGSGFWRWRFRGGVSADAFSALWGGTFDWLAAGGDDRRGAVPATAWSRAGEPVVWRRGAKRDSIVKLTLRSSGTARVDSVTLHFPGTSMLAESPPLPEGEYDVTLAEGHARLVVAPSREWLPRKPSVASGTIGKARATGAAPSLRDAWWPYLLLLAALCAEWLLRRRAGMR